MTLYPSNHSKDAKTVVLLGSGNVASQLLKVLKSLDNYHLAYHYIRSLGMKLSDLPRTADLYIFAISDSSLPLVWQEMPTTTGVWLHLAGSVSMEQMQEYHKPCGVIYPLQTLTKGRTIDWSEIPIYYEGDLEAKLLAEALSKQTHYADSKQRMKLHLAAVFASNYSNYLINLAENYLEEEGLDPKSLLPLLRETYSKLESMSAYKAQTGPARRRDTQTLELHYTLLANDPMKRIYKILAEEIGAIY